MMQGVPDYSQPVQQKRLAKADEKVEKGKLQVKKGTAHDGNFSVTFFFLLALSRGRGEEF